MFMLLAQRPAGRAELGSSANSAAAPESCVRTCTSNEVVATMNNFCVSTGDLRPHVAQGSFSAPKPSRQVTADLAPNAVDGCAYILLHPILLHP